MVETSASISEKSDTRVSRESRGHLLSGGGTHGFDEGHPIHAQSEVAIDRE